jgi:hypothetical protein
MLQFRRLFLGCLLAAPLAASALQQGVAISYGRNFGIESEPDNTRGFSLAYTLQPDTWKWHDFTLGMNFSYGHWKSTETSNYQQINIYAAAPVLRWYFLTQQKLSPFLQGSVGPALLSANHFGSRNLGSTLLFQDMGGFGLAFGPNKQAYATVQVVHYSNADLSSQNGGMTIPLMFTLGYNF